MPEHPKVTVLMPVYNGEKFLREAIDSILNQTFRDFEFLIINDGSTDRSVEIIEAYKDSRIRLIHNETNMKLIATLNKGLNLARGEYLARMDCDDISLPERLSKQFAFMRAHPEVGICGTWSMTVGAVKKSWRTCFPVRHADIVAHLLFNTAISHPTAMFDMKRFRSLNLKYDAAALHAEDYDLWAKAAGHFDLGNVPEVLFLYRVHPEQTSQTASLLQKATAVSVRRKLLGIIGVLASDEELVLHSRIADYPWEKSRNFYAACKDWLQKIDRMADPPYTRAVRRECLKRLIELHKYVFGYRGILGRAYLSLTSNAFVGR